MTPCMMLTTNQAKIIQEQNNLKIIYQEKCDTFSTITHKTEMLN